LAVNACLFPLIGGEATLHVTFVKSMRWS
jgi:hypothetical protein